MEQKDYSKTYEVIWADMDPNRHMRHSVYNDYAAQTRIAMFQDFGLSIQEIATMNLGPILFREETKFFNEIGLSEQITVACKVMTIRKDASRWSFLHEVFRGNGDKAAQIIVDGAWLNLKKRKLEIPPKELLDVVMQFPRTESFEWQNP